jgi:hypothetical protein
MRERRVVWVMPWEPRSANNYGQLEASHQRDRLATHAEIVLHWETVITGWDRIDPRSVAAGCRRIP